MNQNDKISDTVIYQQTFPHPQLDSCFEPNSSSEFYTVGLDCELKLTNFEINSRLSLGKHMAPTNKVVCNSAMNFIITSGWDKQIKFWDKSSSRSLTNSINTGINITGLLSVGNRLVVTGSTDFTRESDYNLNSHIINIYDLRNLSTPEKSYESPLKNETRSICAINPSDGFVIGGPEGKISVEFFKDLSSNEIDSNMNLPKREYVDSNPIIKQCYAFKCHREEVEGMSIIHSINALAYHPRYIF